mgnify:FL=1|jgi:hypothetical protein|tara:strand:+ start:3165 stop:3413 length:249 start_codon:yes stop_codon:yes gene_type:complete
MKSTIEDMKLVLFDPKTEECLAESEEEMWDYLGEYLNQDNIKTELLVLLLEELGFSRDRDIFWMDDEDNHLKYVDFNEKKFI